MVTKSTTRDGTSQFRCINHKYPYLTLIAGIPLLSISRINTAHICAKNLQPCVTGTSKIRVSIAACTSSTRLVTRWGQLTWLWWRSWAKLLMLCRLLQRVIAWPWRSERGSSSKYAIWIHLVFVLIFSPLQIREELVFNNIRSYPFDTDEDDEEEVHLNEGIRVSLSGYHSCLFINFVCGSKPSRSLLSARRTTWSLMAKQYADAETAGVLWMWKTRTTANLCTCVISWQGGLPWLDKCLGVDLLLEHTYKTSLKQLPRSTTRRSGRSSWLRSRRGSTSDLRVHSRCTYFKIAFRIPTFLDFRRTLPIQVFWS